MDIRHQRVGLESKFFEICQTVTKSQGLDLYDMKYIPGNQTLRMYIVDQKSGSALIEDCVRVDRAMTDFLQEDWVPEGIVLEVSSPGVYRELVTLEHFQSAVGQMISAVLIKTLDSNGNLEFPKGLKGQKKIRALLSEVSEEGVVLDFDGYVFSIKYSDLKKAHLDPSLKDLNG